MVKLIRQSLSGSTLPESIIAMVIIMMVFSIAMGIYVRVQASATSGLNRQINYKMNDLILLNLRGQNKEAVLVHDSITYHQLRSDYKNYSDLVLIEIRAEKRGQILAFKRAVVKKSVEEDAK